MRLNVKPSFPHGFTHEGAPAATINAEQALRRSVLSCFLWESGFYEDGEEIADRIIRIARDVSTQRLCELSVEARESAKLRHVPLLLLSIIAKTRSGGTPLLAEAIERVVQRADELAELLTIHARLNGVSPKGVKKVISAQMKKGLAAAFRKFDEYQLAKYDRAGVIRLRDVLFMVHAKPIDDAQAALWKQLAESALETPDTWEVALSSGADKKETFERLITGGRLGYLALLRNIRNASEAGCDPNLIKLAILARKGADRVLPFRYIAAARAAPQFEREIDTALLAAIEDLPKLSGETALLIDVSYSMEKQLSKKSDMRRIDAAAGLAAIWNGPTRIFTFSDGIVEVPPRRGMAGVDAIIRSQEHNNTYLGEAMRQINNRIKHDRLVVITDEQSHDAVPPPVIRKAYMINVASAQRGVGYGRWTHIDGFSENVLRFIAEQEKERA